MIYGPTGWCHNLWHIIIMIMLCRRISERAANIHVCAKCWQTNNFWSVIVCPPFIHPFSCSPRFARKINKLSSTSSTTSESSGRAPLYLDVDPSTMEHNLRKSSSGTSLSSQLGLIKWVLCWFYNMRKSLEHNPHLSASLLRLVPFHF